MRKSVLAAALAAVMLLSGCSGVSQEEYNSLLEENSILKESSSSSPSANSSSTTSSIESDNKIANTASDLLTSGIEPTKRFSEKDKELGCLTEWYIYDKDDAVYIHQFDNLSDKEIASSIYIISNWHKLGVDTYAPNGIQWESDYLIYKRKDGTIIVGEKFTNENKNGSYSQDIEWSDEKVKIEFENGLADKSLEKSFNEYLKTHPHDIVESSSNDSSSLISEPSDNISIKTAKTLDGKVCAFITNNGEKTVDELEIQILYKDTSGNVIDTDSDGHDMVLPN